jgi:hypothetical protein
MSTTRIQNTQSELFATQGVAHRQRTVSSTAVDLINSVPLNSKTTHVLVQFTGATARLTLDGSTTPTATLGFQYVAGSSALFAALEFPMIRAIREAETDVVAIIQEMTFR